MQLGKLNSIINKKTIDVNALAYLNASGITDNIKIKAVSNFVKRLKSINTVQPNFVRFDNPSLSILKAVYPWGAGSDYASRKFNLIDPRDDDSAYRLSEDGTFTHNVNYIQSNGTNAKYRTHYIPDDSRLDHHAFAYFRNETAKTGFMVSAPNFEYNPCFAGNADGSNLSYGYMKTQGVGVFDMLSPNGLIGFNQPSEALTGLMWVNNSKVRTDFNKAVSTIHVTREVYLFARQDSLGNPTYYSFKSSFVSIGWGMSELAYNMYYQAIQQLHIDCGSYETVNWPDLGTRYFIQPIENNYYRADMPSICPLGGNNYIIAYGAFPNVQVGDGSTCYIESKQTTDSFTTLGNHIRIYRSTVNGGFGTDVSDMIPSLYKQNSGNIICICLVKLTTTTSELRKISSSDNGLTWGTGTKIYGVAGKYYTPAGNRIMKSSTGRLFYPFSEFISGASMSSQIGNYNTKLLYSDDDGDTWNLMSGVELISPDNLAVEPGCLQKPDNTVVVYFRTRSKTVYAANSTDDGTTFGAVYDTTLKAPDSTSAIIYSSRIGKYIAVHNFRINFGSGATIFGSTARTLMRISTSTDFATWTKFTDLDEQYNYYMFEPCIQDLGSEFIIAYSRVNSNESLIDMCYKKIVIT